MNNTINGVNITKNNIVSQLMYTADSGSIIYRNKLDTLIGIKHPGIILGTDVYGTVWVIHNHYEIGYPQIVTWDKFTLGVPVIYDDRPVTYDRMEIVSRAIESWKNKQEYSWLFHNCQHFVNKVARDRAHSESLNRIGNNLIAAGLAGGAIGHNAKNKAIGNFGLCIALIGFIIKMFNK